MAGSNWRRWLCGAAPLWLLLAGVVPLTTLASAPALASPIASPVASPVAPRVAAASVASPADALTGTLARVRQAGVVRIGYREHAPPFSIGKPGSIPYGYSIDLCLVIVEQMAEVTGGRPLRVEYRPVTPEDRIDLVASGAIDLECGATTNTPLRRQRVAFSPLTFVTGTRLAVPRASGIRSMRDLAQRRIAVARGTTNEAALRQIVAKAGARTKIVTTQDVAQAFALVAAGRADAVASDDVLLLGHLAESGQRARYDLVGELLSYEPYGIMYARDDAPLAEVVAAAFERLARTRELRWIYVRWFERQLPSGLRLALPMSPQLQRAFEMMGLPPD
jgi:glutamate/aspartate transport system substrate-binding protein